MLNWFLNLNFQIQLAVFFVFGLMTGMLLMSLLIRIKNKKLNAYQRKLEIESISSNENSAKVKVLESKIQVLEKALENALKK
ncbi:hypothetical protein IKB17_01725 [bacterium]|nr:hypothetical protein [bacterium]